MANVEHLKIFKKGIAEWNDWRDKNHESPEVAAPDLSGIFLEDENLLKINFSKTDLSGSVLNRVILEESNLQGANLSGAFVTDAKLSWANLSGANLSKADLSRSRLLESNLVDANLSECNLTGCYFGGADLSNANLTRAILYGANLIDACLAKARLLDADLTQVSLIETDLTDSLVEGSTIYGINVWDISKEGMLQKGLTITKNGAQAITVDDLEIAQFIYLLLNNQKIRTVIETINSKAVLILGRFTDERKKILDAIRDELRNRDFLPILFDFEKPATRDLTETISILANLSRFVIADLTDAKSIPQELSHIIPFMPNLPVVPIILNGQEEYAMFEHCQRYPWVLPIFAYRDESHLLESLTTSVIDPVERKVQEIRGN